MPAACAVCATEAEAVDVLSDPAVLAVLLPEPQPVSRKKKVAVNAAPIDVNRIARIASPLV